MNATTPVIPSNHVDEVTGLLYIEGQLEPASARGVVAHLERCPACRRLLDTLKRESLLLREALTEADEPLPARLLAPRLAEGVSWAWLTALGLAAAGLYAFWNIYVGPWMETLDQSGFGGQFIFTWLLFNGASWKGWNDMLQWVIVGSLVILATVLLFLFRRNLRRLTSISVFLAVALLLSLGFAPPAQATEFVKTRSTYEVPAGQTVRNDLFIFGNSAHIDGTLDGDLFFFGHSLTVDGQVTGDVFAFADSVRIKGKVGGNVRTFNQSISIEGDVARSVMSFVNHFELPAGATVGGSATLFVEDMQIEGRLGRDLCAFAGEGKLDGRVGGEVRLYQDRHARGVISVGSRADVAGDFHYRGPTAPDVSSNAKLASAPHVEIVHEVPDYLRSYSYWYNAMIWGMAFVIGLLFISVAPGFVQQASREVSRIGAPLGLGLVAFLGLPIAAVVACVTVVGLGVGISAFFLWVFLLCFAQVFTAVWLGETLMGTTSEAWPMTGRLALGLLVLRLGALIPVIGFWVRFIACVLGMGALVLLIFRRVQRPIVPSPMAAAPAAPAA